MPQVQKGAFPVPGEVARLLVPSRDREQCKQYIGVSLREAQDLRLKGPPVLTAAQPRAPVNDCGCQPPIAQAGVPGWRDDGVAWVGRRVHPPTVGGSPWDNLAQGPRTSVHFRTGLAIGIFGSTEI